MGGVLSHWLAAVRQEEDDLLFTAQDRARRSGYVRMIATVNMLILLLPILAGIVAGDPLPYLVAGAIQIAINLGVIFLNRLGYLDLAAFLLSTLGLPLLLVILLLSNGNLGMLPFFTLIPVITASLVLRPRGIATVLIMVLLTLAVMYLIARSVPQPLPNPAMVTISVLTLVLVLGMYTIYAAVVTQRAFRLAYHRAEDASRTVTALAESEWRFRLIAENSTDLVGMLNEEGLYIYASPSYGQILGRSEVEMVGSAHLELIHPDDRPAAVAQQRQAELVSVSQVTYRMAHSDRSWRWIEVRLSAVRDLDERLFVLAAHDVTDQRRLEQQLRQAQKMDDLGRLAGSVAHDFNNLLVVIEGSTELAANSLPTDHEAQDDLLAVRQASARAAGLTRQLLAFARRQVIAPRTLDLSEALRESERLLRRLLPPNITIEVQLAPTIWPVIADPGQIQQVIMNLALNARDAMPAGGTLRLLLNNSWRRPPGEQPEALPQPFVCLEVLDTGVGIAPDEQRHLFEPFYTTKAPGKGTGLGLATCYGIVTQCGGAISVSSELGVGTRFTVLLPRAAAPVHQAANALVSAPATSAIWARVLFVEDNAAVRQLGARLLREANYDVIEAGSAEEALALSATCATPIDLLLTDIELPGRNGAQLALSLSRQRPGLRVLLTSGHSEYASHAQDHLEDGVAFLAKPWRPDDLLNKVRLVLEARPVSMKAKQVAE
ncbi:MAG: ATP-binding protein [Oscillochloridaceae bacterium umkhey_bin13]